MATWRLSNIYFFYFATIGIVMPYWGVYLDYLEFNAREIGQLMAIFLATKMIAPNIWATVADLLAERRGSSVGLIKIATALTVIIYTALYWVSGFWAVGAVMLGYCIFWNATLPQLEAITLNNLLDKNQYGRIRLWGSVGFIITVVFLGYSMDIVGEQSILHAGTIALVLLFFSSLLLAAPTMESQSNQTDERENTAGVSKLLTPKIVIVLLFCMCMQLSHAPLQTFLSIYLRDHGFSHVQIGLLWSVGVFCEIGIFLLASRLLQTYSLVGLLVFTFFIAAVRWMLLGLFPESLSIVLGTQAMHAITFGLYHTAMIRVIDRLFIGRYQVRGQALYSSISYGLGGALGALLSGYIWEGLGDSALFICSGLFMLIISTIAWKVLPELIPSDSQSAH